MNSPKPIAVYPIRKEEWIILRLLYLIMALDPSMARVDDIQRTLLYLKRKHPYGDSNLIHVAFDLLRKEHGTKNTFNEIGAIKSIRKLQDSIEIRYGYESEEEKEFMQRRVFGLSKSEHPSGVIQDIVDKINLNMGEKK